MLSAEIRWFWRGSSPSGLRDWFCGTTCNHGLAAAGDPRGRSDAYLLDPNQKELGVKKRGNAKENKGVELKTLVGFGSSDIAAAPFVAPAEFWVKVNSGALNLSHLPLIAIRKVRRLRKFDTSANLPIEIELEDNSETPKGARKLPVHGCNVEFTDITIESCGEKWCTFGFEAFGSLSTVESSLKATAMLMTRRNFPGLMGGILASYPVWLTDFCNSKGS